MHAYAIMHIQAMSAHEHLSYVCTMTLWTSPTLTRKTDIISVNTDAGAGHSTVAANGPQQSFVKHAKHRSIKEKK